MEAKHHQSDSQLTSWVGEDGKQVFLKDLIYCGRVSPKTEYVECMLCAVVVTVAAFLALFSMFYLALGCV